MHCVTRVMHAAAGPVEHMHVIGNKKTRMKFKRLKHTTKITQLYEDRETAEILNPGSLVQSTNVGDQASESISVTISLFNYTQAQRGLLNKRIGCFTDSDIVNKSNCWRAFSLYTASAEVSIKNHLASLKILNYACRQLLLIWSVDSGR
jgi:hypothetical protein